MLLSSTSIKTALPRRLMPGLLAFVFASSTMLGSASSAKAFELFGFSFFEDDEATEDVPLDPVSYEATLIVESIYEDLEETLEDRSDLLNSQDNQPDGLAGLIQRIRTDIGRLTRALYENSYYEAEIEVTVAGQNVDDLDPFGQTPAQPVPVTILVKPGSPYVFGRVDIRNAPPDFVPEEDGLVSGQPALSGVIIDAESQLLAAWKDLGYPLAKSLPRDIVADHETNRLDVTIGVDPGPRAFIGQARVEGAQDVNETLILRRAGLERGKLYSAKDIEAAENRLRKLEVFSSVRIELGDSVDFNGQIPVLIRVEERKFRVIGASASFSTTEGAAIGAYWMHRNLFGGAERLRIEGELSGIGEGEITEPEGKFQIGFRKPAVLTPMTDFFATTGFEREETEAYEKIAAYADIGLGHEISEELSVVGALAFEQSEVKDDLQTDSYSLFSVRGQVNYDSRDSRLNPTEGYLAALKVEPTYDIANSNTFLNSRIDGATYFGFGNDDRFVLAVRTALATLTVDDVRDVPSDKRLFAGGAGSIRGYAYKNVGPRNANGDLIGGTSLFEISSEIRAQMTETIGIAIFADAGNAYSDQIPDFGDFKIGVGAGLRYLTAVGPIRLDVAVPLDPERDDPSFAFYVGLGQAF
jgi:translocation and assembly module TamA